MTRYEAACELIREINLNLVLVEVGRDTETDHRALHEARTRFDQIEEER